MTLSAIQSESYTLTTGELGRVPSEDSETDLGTKCLEQDHIETCMTKMRVLIVGAWAGKQLPVVSGTGVTIGEDLLKDHSWTTDVVLLITVGVGLLSCVCAVNDPHLPTGSVHVTGEPEVARQPRGMTLGSVRTKIINHGNERTWSLSWYSGDQLWQLMEMLSAQYGRDTLYSSCGAWPSGFRGAQPRIPTRAQEVAAMLDETLGFYVKATGKDESLMR